MGVVSQGYPRVPRHLLTGLVGTGLLKEAHEAKVAGVASVAVPATRHSNPAPRLVRARWGGSVCAMVGAALDS